MIRRVQSVWHGQKGPDRGALGVLVGQAPSRTGRPDRCLTGSAGRAIAEACGLEFPGAYARAFDRVNVYEAFPGTSPSGGDLFPTGGARERAMALAPELAGRTAILLGRGVARAFGLPIDAPWYSGWHVAMRTCTSPSSPDWCVFSWACHAHDSHPEGTPCWPSIEEVGATVEAPIPTRRWHDHAFRAFVAPHPSRVSRHWSGLTQREEAWRWWSQVVVALRAQRAVS